MYSVDPLEMCTEFFKLYHIRLQLFSSPYDNGENIDFGLRKTLNSSFNYAQLLSRLESIVLPGEILYIQDGFGNSYNLFSLKEGPVNSPYTLGVLGPWRRGDVSESVVKEIIDHNNLPREYMPILKEVLNRVPQNMKRDKWIPLCTRLIGKLISPDGNVRFRVSEGSTVKAENFVNITTDEKSLLERIRTTREQGYSLEQSLLAAIKKCNYAYAEDLSFKYINFMIQYKKNFNIPTTVIGIEFNALLRHAAREAGVLAVRLEDTYMKYCKHILQSNGHIPHSTMVRDYCNLISEYSGKHLSIHVQKCIDFIGFYFYQPISLRELAVQNNITEQYLSTLFHKELGISFTDYLTDIRINNAKLMLQENNKSILEIAVACGFNDSSYFSRIFKKTTGISPTHYRKSIMLE